MSSSTFSPYARIELPTLCVFTRPDSVYGRMSEHLRHLDEGEPAEFDAYLSQIPPAVAFDFMMRHSAHIHELRHFHDLLATHAGTLIFVHGLHALWMHIRLAAALQGSLSGQSVRLPLVPGEVAVEAELVAARDAWEQMRVAIHQSEAVLEMLAWLTQLQYVHSYCGAVASDVVTDAILRGRHGEILHALELKRRHWELEDATQWNAFLTRLLVDFLSASNRPLDLLTSWLRLAASDESIGFDAHRRLHDAVLDQLVAETGSLRDLDRRVLDALRSEIAKDRSIGEEVKTLLAFAVEDFAELSAGMRRRHDEQAEVFLTPLAYLQWTEGSYDVPLPRTYQHFPDDVALFEPRDGYNVPAEYDHEFFHVQRYTRDSLPRRFRRALGEHAEVPIATRVVVRPFNFPLGGMPVDRRWADLAADVAGAFVLTTGRDPTSPVHGYWLEDVAPRLGLRFR